MRKPPANAPVPARDVKLRGFPKGKDAAPAVDRTRRVWIVSEVFGPEENSTGVVLDQLAAGLSHRYDVGIISAAPFDRSEDKPVSRTRIVMRALRGFIQALSLGARLCLRARRGDVAIVLTNPPLLPIIASLTGVFGIVTIVLIHDVYPDAMYASEVIRPGPLTRLFNRMNTAALSHAKRVIVIGRDMEELIAGKLGKRRNRIVCIPNWFDIGIAGAATEHGSRDEPIVVQYSGKMGSLHNDGLLLEAAEILLRRGVNARIEVRTWGRNARSFAEAVHTRGLSNVRFLEPCSRDQLEAQLSLCDVGLITMKKGTAGISVPCRIYNRLACARPVLAAVDADSEVARVIEESGAGVVIDPDDPTALADAISYFEVNRSSLPEMGRRGAVHVAARYSFETALERYRLIIDETANWSNPI